MPITKEQAVKLKHGDLVHYGECKKIVGPRGGVKIKRVVARVTGKVRTWVGRPNDFTVPIKHGLYESAYIREVNAEYFHLASECPID